MSRMRDSAHEENMLSTASAAASAAKRTADALQRIEHKVAADRASILSEWTDRDMMVGERLYKAGTVTLVDILDHATARASQEVK